MEFLRTRFWRRHTGIRKRAKHDQVPPSALQIRFNLLSVEGYVRVAIGEMRWVSDRVLVNPVMHQTAYQLETRLQDRMGVVFCSNMELQIK